MTVTRSVSVYGGWDGAPSGLVLHDPDAYTTTLDGESLRRGVYVNSGITVALEGLVVSNGWVLGDGGGLFARNAALTLRGMAFISNVITATEYVYGAGAFVVGGTLHAEACTFRRNWGFATRYSFGGGLAISQTLTATLTSCLFEENDTWHGSGLYLAGAGRDKSRLVLSDSTFLRNGQGYSDPRWLGGYCSAVDVADVRARIERNSIRGNLAVNDYGAVAAFSSDLELTGNVITGNSNGRTSALYLYLVRPFTVTNNVIAGNQTERSAYPAVRVRNSSGQFVHNTIASNAGGPGLRVDEKATAWLTNTILVSHTVGITVSAGSTVTLEATLWGIGSWANGSERAGAGLINLGAVNVRGSPAFVDPELGDYHIAADSAAIDTGVNAAVTTDIDGETRPHHSGYDIGADEYLGPLLVRRRVYLPVVLRNHLPPVPELVVTNASDVVDGDVSSPAALLGNPGADGVSLREAITAANNAGAPQVTTFAGALGGETIVLKKSLMLTRDGTTLTGLVGGEGQPTLALDGHEADQVNGLLYILASDITVRQLRIVDRVNGGVFVLAGRNQFAEYPDQPQPRQEVRNVAIEGNVFSDTASTPDRGAAVRIYMEPEAASVGASIEDVRVIGNAFLGISPGLEVAANGTDCQIRDVVIADNYIEGGAGAVTAQGSNNHIVGTRILHNTFVAAFPQPILFIAHLVDPKPPRGTSNTGGVIDGTVVEGNSFSGTSSVWILGGQDGASGCTVSNTDLVNNSMFMGDIGVLGGKWGATGNRINGLRLINNTLMAQVDVTLNSEGGTENTISGLTLRNTILGLEGFLTHVEPEAVSYCLTESGGFPGNGNRTGDPRFVNRAAGDFDLLADSPAIDAGTADGAPATDIECRPRAGAPDIGAHEFGAPTVARLFLSIDRGSGTVGHSPAGFECGSAASFVTGAVVELTAHPATGSRFRGWSGDADCLDGAVTMSADRHCAATFDRPGSGSDGAGQ